jgi:hypothetical protein
MGYPMSDPTTLPGAAAPWYTSAVQKAQLTTAIGALIALSPKLGTLIGIKTPADIAMWVESLAGAFTVGAPIFGMIKRALSKLQPLTLTQAKADAHPATIAAETAVSPPRAILPDPVTTPLPPINQAPIPGKPWGTS